MSRDREGVRKKTLAAGPAVAFPELHHNLTHFLAPRPRSPVVSRRGKRVGKGKVREERIPRKGDLRCFPRATPRVGRSNPWSHDLGSRLPAVPASPYRPLYALHADALPACAYSTFTSIHPSSLRSSLSRPYTIRRSSPRRDSRPRISQSRKTFNSGRKIAAVEDRGEDREEVEVGTVHFPRLAESPSFPRGCALRVSRRFHLPRVQRLG